MLHLGPVEMLYTMGSELSREKKQVIVNDFKKRWAVKKAICTQGESPSGYDMEEDYEIIGEFDLWSEAMKCRNNEFYALPSKTICVIDDPEATRYSISGLEHSDVPMELFEEIPKGTKFVKLWCVINLNQMKERRALVGILQEELSSMEGELSVITERCCSEQDEQKKLALKQEIAVMKEQYQSKKLEMERMSRLVTADTPFKEVTDQQPGVELAYIYHRDNTFVPTGVQYCNGSIQHVLNLTGHRPMRIDEIDGEIKNDSDL